MRRQPTPDERRQMLEYFMDGGDINHVMFRMGYDHNPHGSGGYFFDSEDVNQVLRREMERLQWKSAELQEAYDRQLVETELLRKEVARLRQAWWKKGEPGGTEL